MRAHSLAHVAVIASALIGMTAGCGKSDRPPLGTVSGVVTFGGQPLPDAMVMFTPDGPGRTSLGMTDTLGRYTLTFLRDIMGANVGRHVVRISTATEENGGRELLPARYHEASVLSAEVQPGSNTFDFSLEADAEAP